MESIFIKLLNMSISASWLVIAVILIRIILKSAPKWTRCMMWGLVGVRLIWPFSWESIFSLIPSAEVIPQDIMYAKNLEIHSGVIMLNNIVNPIISESSMPMTGASVNPMQVAIFIASNIWVIGILVMLVYSAVSYIRIRKKVSVSLRHTEDIYYCDYIDTPFILGIVKPKIYIPSGMAEDISLEYVIAHEHAHIRRHDHWWKPFGFLLLTIYWFNPVLWGAYILLCRDIELACDEYVIRDLGDADKKYYSDALLSCSVPRRMIAACPLAFGEVGVKNRVKEVLNYRKPAFWILVISLVACVAAAVCFLTNPAEDKLHAPEPFGHSYKVEEILYDAPQYSFTYSTDTAPRYQFTSDYVMFVAENALSKGSLEWVQQKGGFEEVKITTENFDNYFNMSGFQISNDRWSKFRNSIKKAWRMDIENDENHVFYYLISTKSGDVYLTYGYHDAEGETDPNSNDSSIRWLFKLERIDLLTCNVVSDGINAFLGLTSFPDKIDRNTDNWPVAQINEIGVLQFSLEGDINALVVSEDYYRKDENEVFIERNSFEVGREDDGFFRIDVACRESLEDHVNYFINIKGQSDVYAMKVIFVDNNHIDIGAATESAPSVMEWFDYFQNPGSYQESKIEITQEAFPDVTFRYAEYQIIASKGKEETVLIQGMPIWNAYFTDLTGDGLPDICAMLSIGSGMIDNRIIIYDYANGVSYELEDRGNHDYTLSLQDGRLVVTKYIYNSSTIVKTGYLDYVDETVTIVPMEEYVEAYYDLEQAVSKAILDHYASENPDGLIHVESHALLANESMSGTPLRGQKNHIEKTVLYLLVRQMKYSTYDGKLEEEGGSYGPVAITFSIDETGAYTLEEYWEPRDGSYYTDDIRKKFPELVAKEAFDKHQAYSEELSDQCYQKALEVLETTGSLDIKIEELLEEICSSPGTFASNPSEYITAHDAEYQELLDYGKFSLQYCFEQFLQGSQTDLRGHIMAIICREITQSLGEAVLMWDSEPPIEAQAWFDAFMDNAQSLTKQYSKEELEKYYPASWLLLQLAEAKDNQN